MPRNGFDYLRPTDWPEAGRLLAEPDAIAKMGGCGVLSSFRRGELKARLVVGLNQLPEVDALGFGVDGARIGAAVTLARLERDPRVAERWPVLAETLAKIASPAIRNSATVVGNVAQGSPMSDLVPLFQVCEATLDVRGPQGQRWITVSDYAKTPGNAALRPGEAIAALALKTSGRGTRMVYERFSFKQAFDSPIVSVAVAAQLEGDTYRHVKVSAVGAATMPTRCASVEAVLEGKSVRDKRAMEAAAAAIAHSPAPPDPWHRASAAYRRHVLGVLLGRALSRLAIA